MTQEESDDINRILKEIREKLVCQTDDDLYNTNNTMDYKVNMLDPFHTIDASQWPHHHNINTWTTNNIPPITTTQIQNMGIGTTGSMAPFTFDIGKLNHKDFETYMPGIHKINEMCDMFPGFKKAWDHMRTVYDLVQEEYKERKKTND